MRVLSHISIISYVIVAMLVLCLLNGCSNTIASDKFVNGNHPHVSDAISVMTPFDDEMIKKDMYGAAFVDTFELWSGSSVEESVVRENDYYLTVNSYATMERGLPDVFVLPYANLKLWIDEGLISNEVYLFPVKNYTLIAYDKVFWNSIGYSQFPSDADSLNKAREEALDKGYDGVLEWNLRDGRILRKQMLFPKLILRNEELWLGEIEENSENIFLSGDVIDSLEEIKAFCRSGLFEEIKGRKVKSNDTLGKLFAEGKYPATVISTDDFFELRYNLLESGNPNMENLYRNLAFSFLPSGNVNEETSLYTVSEYKYALVINSKVEEDLVKYKECKDFCEFMTGQSYADEFTRLFGIKGDIKTDIHCDSDDVVMMNMADLINNMRCDVDTDVNEYGYSRCGDVLDRLSASDRELIEWIWEDKNNSRVVANLMQDSLEISRKQW